MDWMIWPGAGVALLGVIGLLYCIVSALRARARRLAAEQMQERLQQLVVLNMAALGVSAIGLMMVVAGILLG